MRRESSQNPSLRSSAVDRLFPAVLLLTVLSGCELFESLSNLGEQRADVPATVEPKKDVEENVDELLLEEEEDAYSYNPNGKRDPFRSFFAIASSSSAIDNIPRTPLQKYDISEYKLTGIIWGIDRPRALVEDPEGIGHVMELGTYIGKHWGKVKAIEEGEVTVVEEYETQGEKEIVPVPYKLRLEVPNGVP